MRMLRGVIYVHDEESRTKKSLGNTIGEGIHARKVIFTFDTETARRQIYVLN